MGEDNPWVLLVMIAGAGYLGRLWLADLQAARAGRPLDRAFPGAVPAGSPIMLLAVGGTLLMLAAETAGERALGLTAGQSRITALFGLYTLGAAVVEEIVFRGYLVVLNRGRAAMLGSVLLASLLFAGLHPFLWSWQEDGLQFELTARSAFNTAAIFLGSLWFYALRILPLNPQRSLAPCLVAHLTRNLGVIAIKAAEGFISGWW